LLLAASLGDTMQFVNHYDDEEDDECSEAERRLLTKLEKYFQSEGLSKFSSRAAVAYFQVGQPCIQSCARLLFQQDLNYLFISLNFVEICRQNAQCYSLCTGKVSLWYQDCSNCSCTSSLIVCLCGLSVCSLNNKHSSNEHHPGQKGCPGVIPGLRAFPVWFHTDLVTDDAAAADASRGQVLPSAIEYPWVAEVESYFDRVRNEFRQQQGHQAEQGGIKFQVSDCLHLPYNAECL
jgi:hypothetical protein